MEIEEVVDDSESLSDELISEGIEGLVEMKSTSLKDFLSDRDLL